MCVGLEESATECVDHLQLGVQVMEEHVLKILINKEEFLVKYCVSLCVDSLFLLIFLCMIFTELCEKIHVILFSIMSMR